MLTTIQTAAARDMARIENAIYHGNDDLLNYIYARPQKQDWGKRVPEFAKEVYEEKIAENELNSYFDVKIYINAANEGYAAQTMEVYRKDEDGSWQPVYEFFQKISSGAGFRPTDDQPYIWTIPGIFTMHPTRHAYTPYGTMPYKMYFDYKYCGGRQSNIALHGTKALKKLGEQASHGCIRQNTEKAKRLYEWVHQETDFTGEIPLIQNQCEYYGGLQLDDEEEVIMYQGLKVLIVVYYGYLNEPVEI